MPGNGASKLAKGGASHRRNLCCGQEVYMKLLGKIKGVRARRTSEKKMQLQRCAQDSRLKQALAQ